MSIFLPKGLKPGGVIDPDELGDEFVRASTVATDTSQYQWVNNALFSGSTPQIDLLKNGTPVIIEQVSQKAFLRGTNASPSVARTDYDADPGNDPLLDSNGDGQLYHIPYNRGFGKITGAQDMEISWTNEYPELIMTAFSFQFIRERDSNFNIGDGTTVTPRTQIRIVLDGGTIPGAGIYADPGGTTFRGTGYAGTSLRTTIVGLTLAPPGTHSIVAEAAQSPTESTLTLSTWGFTAYPTSFEVPPDQGVCIAHRTLMLFRFPRGGWIEGG